MLPLLGGVLYSVKTVVGNFPLYPSISYALVKTRVLQLGIVETKSDLEEEKISSFYDLEN